MRIEFRRSVGLTGLPQHVMPSLVTNRNVVLVGSGRIRIFPRRPVVFMTVLPIRLEGDLMMTDLKMKTPPIVTPQEWEAARVQLLVKEKALTHARDALAAERRRMPWLAIERQYEFDGPERTGSACSTCSTAAAN